MPKVTVSQLAEDLFLAGLEETLEETSGSKVKDGISSEVLERGQKWAESKDPLECLYELYGYRSTPDLDRYIAEMEANPRVLGIGAHDASKTHGGTAYTLGWRYYAKGCLPAPDDPRDVRGCLLVLLSNTQRQTLQTSYAACRRHAETALSRGFEIPGFRGSSAKTVTWVQHQSRWLIIDKAFQMPAAKGGQVDAAAGLKHPWNLQVFVEEANRMQEMMWTTVEGWNYDGLTGVLNPYQSETPAHQLTENSRWRTAYFSWLRHPSVLKRKLLIPGGADHLRLESEMRDPTRVEELGLASEVKPDPAKHEFPYALPNPGMPDKPGPRADGVPGHPDAEVRVFRPYNSFVAGRLGEYPAGSPLLVFQAAAWRNGVALRRGLELPDWMPEVVGGDMAEGGPDKISFTPRWGRSARSIWRRYQAELATGVSYQDAREAALRCDTCGGTGEYQDPDVLWCASCREFEWTKGDPIVPRCPNCEASGRAWLEPSVYACDCWGGKLYCYLGEPVNFPKTDDMDMLAGQIVREFGVTHYNLDQSGGGYPLAPALKRLGCSVTLVPFGAAPPERLEGQKDFLMQRDAMYGQLADATLLEAVALPESQKVAAGCRVLEWETVERSVKGNRVDKAKIQAKSEVKAKVGPDGGFDEADSVGLTEAHIREEVKMGVYPGGVVVGG